MEKEINYRLVTELIFEKLLRNHERYKNKYPHISNLMSEGGRLDYEPMDNNLWTSSFFPGEMLLAYSLTGAKEFIADKKSYLDSFEKRLNEHIGISHDLGFLYSLTCVALYKLTEDKRAKEIAAKAADELYHRFNRKGNYIQAWGKMNVGDPYVLIIADTMLNLPLLYQSEDPKHAEAAMLHARTASRTIVRKDFSSFHTYLMDPMSGSAIEGRTHQGFRDSSTWARGQAWIVYGYALSYSYTKDKEFLNIACKAADYFLERLPKDKVAYWDLSFNDAVPDIRDSSAAAILACGLLELSVLLDDHIKIKKYIRTAKEIVSSLYENYFNHDMNSPVVLTNGMYHRELGSVGTSWGDYFFLEALARLLDNHVRFW